MELGHDYLRLADSGASQGHGRSGQMRDSIEQLIYELAMAGLAEQERMLLGMRVTAGTLIGVATVTGGLRAPSVSSAPTMGAVALVSYVLSVACAVWVLLPRGLTFALRGADLRLADRCERLPSLDVGYLLASRWAERHVYANRRTIARIALSLSLGCFLLLIEVVSLTLAAAW